MSSQLLPEGYSEPPEQPPTAGGRLEALKAASFKAAVTLRERTAQAAAATGSAVQNATKQIREKDWSREQEALTKVKTATIGAADRVAKGGAAVWRQTAEGLKRVFGGPLVGIAKQESSVRPCPRLILVCCTSIVTSGLQQPDMFKADADEDEVYCLFGAFENAHGLVLPPDGISPLVLAAVIKKFLLTLPEPLLTFKFVPDFMLCEQNPQDALSLLPKLPTVNFNTLHMLLETLSRISEHSAENGMTAQELARAVAPVVAWHPIPRQNKGWFAAGAEAELPMEQDGYAVHPRLELNVPETEAIIAVLTYLISTFAQWNEGIVFT